MRIKSIVVKTTGSLFDEFRQFVSGHVLCSKLRDVELKFITSDAFKEEFVEYFHFDVTFIQIADITSEKYHYDPQNQEKLLNDLVAYEGDSDDCVTYFIYEPVCNEFKRADMDIYSFIKGKKTFLTELKRAIHQYVYPQLSMLFVDDKINVGLLYDPELTSEVYARCDKPDLFNYIDFTSVDSRETRPFINKYNITGDFLLFIALLHCDMILGSWDARAYEAICYRDIMLLDVSRNGTKVKDTLIPIQIVMNQTSWFPNSQLLLEFI
tara:strand:+ start:329 stop:1129 length:801 start_codon:yes stop_codon:yes gene_type:complete